MDPITASAAIKLIKDILDLVKASKDPKINQKILELQEELIIINNSLIELATENRFLRDKLVAKASAKLEADGFVYLLSEDGSIKNDRYCPNCYQKDTRFFKLIGDGGSGYNCPVCNKYFY